MSYDLNMALQSTGQSLGARGVEYIPPTIREQLQQKKTAIQRDMDAIDAAIKLMDENPTFEKVHDAISKVRGL